MHANVARYFSRIAAIVVATVQLGCGLSVTNDSELTAASDAGEDVTTLAASAGPSTACIHSYSGEIGMIDQSLPWGDRGYNVEAIFGVANLPSRDFVREWAVRAHSDGLRNLVRIDFRPHHAVPVDPGEYSLWATRFVARVNELAGLADVFIVGNEPTIEPASGISAREYADAYNYLYSRKGEMRPGVTLLAAGPAAFSWDTRANRDFLGWLEGMARNLTSVDGFALHAYGDPTRPGCWDPRNGCSRPGWSFDAGFQTFREQIDRVALTWGGQVPIYLTEFNTDTNGLGALPDPAQNYATDWINLAFDAVRSYNDTRGVGDPPVRSLCWFVDRDDGGWIDFSLRSIDRARDDIREEFHNHANRAPEGGGPALVPEPPPAPDGLTPANGSVVVASAVTLACAPSTGASRYAFEIQSWSGSAWQTYYTYQPQISEVTFWPSGGWPRYRWRVRARNEHGWGLWSVWSVFDRGL